MKKTLKFITLSLVLFVGADAKNINHKIEKNDTLSKISVKYNTTLAAILKENNITKNKKLKIGSNILVPNQKEKIVAGIPEIKNDINYKIKKNDTLSRISARYNTPINSILNKNNITRNKTLRIGGNLIIPSMSKKSVTVNNNKKDYTKTKFVGNKYLTKKFNNPNAAKCDKVIDIAKTKLGKKYVWGATGNGNTYDCSSFTQHVYKKLGIDIPRTSRVQSKFGKYVKRGDLKKGDLIFFDTSKKRKGYVNHVGIYLGNNKFIHASSAKAKVVISKLEKNFYSNRFKGARRLIKS